MTTNNDLLSCPFCGHKVIFVSPDETGSGGQWVAPIHVGCNKCKAEQIGNDEAEAKSNWNRRQPAMPADAWQPIETAPKDGRTLLLGRFNSLGKWRTMRGQWMSEGYIAEYWENPDDAEPGWFETSVEADDPPNCWSIEPTHWMPLPKAPDDRRRVEGEAK